MNRFWARRRDGYRIEVQAELDRLEKAFAMNPRGEVDGRYALEWTIELLSRTEAHRLDLHNASETDARSAA